MGQSRRLRIDEQGAGRAHQPVPEEGGLVLLGQPRHPVVGRCGPSSTRSKGRPSIESGRSTSSRSRMVGATSTRVTKPARRVDAERRTPARRPAPRQAGHGEVDAVPRVWYGPTTSTASRSGSTSARSRPTSSSVAARAASRWTRRWSLVATEPEGVGPHEVGRLDQHHRPVAPHLVEGLGHGVDVEALAVRRHGIGLGAARARPAPAGRPPSGPISATAAVRP